MGKEYEASDALVLKRARSYLRLWKYMKWPLLAFGVALIGWGLSIILQHPNPTDHLALRIFHPAVLLALGLSACAEAIWERRAQDRRLLLKLAKSDEADVY